MMKKLPNELQMVICNYYCNMDSDYIILSKEFDKYLYLLNC